MLYFCDKLYVSFLQKAYFCLLMFLKGVTDMKIERLSENQIRCTLNKADLEDKEVLLTELAYGTDKAKELFRDMMQQAYVELGFEVDNIPLMIEAIPVSSECLILIITKVEDPEELDTRFSRFTKAIPHEEHDDDEYEENNNDIEHAADGLFEALGNLTEGLASALGRKPRVAATKREKEVQPFRVFAFKKLDEVIISATLVKDIYNSDNSLYKNPQDSRFYLYLTQDNNTRDEFDRTCNLISEYGSAISTTYATPNHMEEHFKLIIDSNALQTLAQI